MDRPSASDPKYRPEQKAGGGVRTWATGCRVQRADLPATLSLSAYVCARVPVEANGQLTGRSTELSQLDRIKLAHLDRTGLGQLGWPNPVQPSPGQPSRLHLIGSSGADRGWLHLIGSGGVDWIQPSWLHLIGSSGVDRVRRGRVDPVRPNCQNPVQTRPGNLVRLDELDSFRSSWAGCVRSTPLDAVGAGRVGVTVSDAAQPTWSDLRSAPPDPTRSSEQAQIAWSRYEFA